MIPANHMSFDEELAAQPEQENEGDLQQQDQVEDQPEVELL